MQKAEAETMSSYRSARIYVQDRFAGMLSETEEGYSFRYDSEYIAAPDALPVSITMPLTDKEYRQTTLFAFFDGLIPEGWLLDIAVRNWKLDRNDRFGILLATCRDVIGDVSVMEAVS